jgi:hypothetical protein
MTILKYGPFVKNMLRVPRASVIRTETTARGSSLCPGESAVALWGNAIRYCLRGYVTV